MWTERMMLYGITHEASRNRCIPSPRQQERLGRGSPAAVCEVEGGRGDLKQRTGRTRTEGESRSLSSYDAALVSRLPGWQYCTHFADGNTESGRWPEADPHMNPVFLTPGPALFFLAGQPGCRRGEAQSLPAAGGGNGSGSCLNP